MNSSRRGYSLIEMLAVMACITMLLGVGVATLQGLARLERSTRAGRDQDRTVDLLAQTFRADVHRAIERAGEADDALVLKLQDDRTVEYRADGTHVIVTRRQGDKPPRVERFRIRSRGAPRLAWVLHDGHNFARLILPRQDGRGTLHVEAALGLGLREGEEAQP